MRKTVSALLIAIVSLGINGFKNYGTDKSANGYILTNDGSKQEVRFVLRKKSVMLPEQSEYDISDYYTQHLAKYIDASGKKQKMTSEIKEYGFQYAGENFRYQRLKLDKGPMMFNLGEQERFCKLIIDGKCKLYFDFDYGKNALGFNVIQADYILVKDDSGQHIFPNASGGQLLINLENNTALQGYFAGCDELVKKLKKKEFKNDKFIEAVNFYNENCN